MSDEDGAREAQQTSEQGFVPPSAPVVPPQFGQPHPPVAQPPLHGQPQYAQPQYGQPQYAQPAYGQPAYGQPQYGQAPYGQAPYGQSPYGQPQYGQTPYGQPQPGFDPYGHNPFAPHGQQPGLPGASPVWTPPPKPGLIPLRPLAFGTLLGAPFQTLRRNPKATFGSALVVTGVTTVFSTLVIGLATWFSISRLESAAPEDYEAIESGTFLTLILAAIIPFLVAMLGSIFIQGVVVAEVARATLGEKLRMKQLWKITWPRLGPLILWSVVSSVAMLIALAAVAAATWGLVSLGDGFIAAGVALAIFGAIALLVVSIWLSTKLAVVPSIIVMEKAKLGQAISRSWSLTKGYFWKTFGVLALISIILSTASQIITTPLSFLTFIPALIDPTGSDPQVSMVLFVVIQFVVILVTVITSAIVSIVQAAAVALIYIDLRMRKEGLDLELIRFVEARQTGDSSVTDPYLATPGTPSGQTADYSANSQPAANTGSPWQ